MSHSIPLNVFVPLTFSPFSRWKTNLRVTKNVCTLCYIKKILSKIAFGTRKFSYKRNLVPKRRLYKNSFRELYLILNYNTKPV
jgi:hypothetical protein